jgi:hypothetical protein
MVNLPNADEYYGLGQALAKFSQSSSDIIKRERFVAFFGCEPLLCSILWAMIVASGFVAHLLAPNPVHLLWGLLFMKGYATTTKNAALAGCDNKTFRLWSWFYVECIANLDEKVVSYSCVVLQYCSAAFHTALTNSFASLFSALDLLG